MSRDWDPRIDSICLTAVLVVFDQKNSHPLANLASRRLLNSGTECTVPNTIEHLLPPLYCRDLAYIQGFMTGYGCPIPSIMVVSSCSRKEGVMPSNGETSKNFGVYKTLCCDAEIVIGVGVVFPDCPNHKNLPTQWKQLSDVVPENYRPNTAGKINLSGMARRKPA
jgi:hypothetical protein